ncbi:dUTP diphosphatase [Parahaliea mediterranea]|uniref:dUTP diphosphatase n=1 Tax=Parahaliea mediterranea TaxID=651086 RepID=UPI001475695F|nr:dUTP diphosphatase [Parahaliea mediterranea]
MQQALENMLAMQHRMNTRIHAHWIEQNFAWYRAIWIECGELIEHYGYKWWKKQEPDMEQVRLEVIDIWHFGLSALFTPGTGRDGDDAALIADMAADIAAEVADYTPRALDVREATEALAQHALQSKGFCVSRFWDLMLAAGLDFQSLYSAYVGKNVLNFFRQDNGYKDGSYIKNWQGREDNEHLVELMAALDEGAADFADQVYRALEQRYRTLNGA